MNLGFESSPGRAGGRILSKRIEQHIMKLPSVTPAVRQPASGLAGGSHRARRNVNRSRWPSFAESIRRKLSWAPAWTLSAVFATTTWAAPRPETTPSEGIRDNTPAVHALTDARIIPSPGTVIPNGTVVVRDGVIAEVGTDVEPPRDARVWHLKGRTIYPGLIDSYSLLEEAVDTDPPQAEPHDYWNPLVDPAMRSSTHYRVDSERNKKLRGQGVAVRLAAPGAGLIRGTSCLVTTADDPTSSTVVKADVAQHLATTITRDGDHRRRYPNSPMGAMALVRQAFYDARWYRQAQRAFKTDPGTERPETSASLERLGRQLEQRSLFFVEAGDLRGVFRADRLAREFDLNVVILASGKEFQRLDAVRATKRSLVVPVRFPQAPNVATPESARDATLARLMHWDVAPENPARLDEAEIPIALCTHGLDDEGDFLKQIRMAVRHGLAPESALRAVTTTPADLFGVAHRVGRIAKGKAAHLVVTDGDLFDEKTRVIETWVDGRRYVVEQPPPIDPQGTWLVTLNTEDPSRRECVIGISRKDSQWQGTISRGDQQALLEHIVLRDTRLTASLDGSKLDWTGVVRVQAILAPDEGSAWLGSFVWADGSQTSGRGRRIAPTAPTPRQPPDESATADGGKGGNDTPTARPRQALFAVNFPLGAFGRDAPPDQPEVVVLTNATLWTCGPAGVIERGSVKIRSGRIESVGADVSVPAGAMVVDASGCHITPGIIDCHSHMATDGGVNESTQAVTAEVRIGDFIDPSDINIYRQLAGGVTCANILHGSANPIGGQNQVIKLRWGALGEEMKMKEAPPGIKFALGENVKQSNWGDEYTSRYPQTRMGVEQIIRDAFRAAEHYRRRWNTWRSNSHGAPPRKDLELEALVDVLEGRRWIHCHAYRQDEMLALMRTCEAFGVRIGTFQHVLEGYKIAPEMVAHGAMGSAFSDWWAYKFEVYDAIPYNGALMHDAGVVVSFNSDDAELARRLNTEAAKAVKYGGVPAEEALRFVTRNPARQLRIDKWVGTLEPGKHADLVLWDGPPLSTSARVRQTWIDGRKYFDRQEDREAQRQVQSMRSALIQRILTSGEAMEDPDKADEDADSLWPRVDCFCPHSHAPHDL